MLEICATNIQSARSAQAAGAGRIELCSALDSGGLTPSPGLIEAVCQQVQIPVNVLLRPREGNFYYSSAELDIMLKDIRFCREAGAAGIVIGALTPKGQIDIATINSLLKKAAGLDITFHRAFDYTPDPFEALETLVELGIPRVLSSGQAATAYEGRFLLKKLVAQAGERICFMPGAGIHAGNIRDIAESTGAREFHLSGRVKIVPESMQREIPGLEPGYWESNAVVIRAVRAALEH